MFECPNEFPETLRKPIQIFAEKWATSSLRPRPSTDTVRQWQNLLSSWINTPSLPILIRRSRQRGSIFKHSTGRALVPVDNSPASWVYLAALNGQVPSINEIPHLLRDGVLPIAMILKSDECASAEYSGTLSSIANLNKLGWKLCHIKPVGLRTRIPIEELPIERLLDHFRLLLDPANMFLMPKNWGGLGEIEEVTSVMEEIAP